MATNNDRFDLTGRWTLVAGAGQGIGRAVAEAVHDLGGKVACVDVDQGRAEEVADQISGLALVADLTSRRECARVVADTIAEAGRLDGLVDIIGMWPTDHWGPLHEVGPESWKLAPPLVLDHAFHLSRAVVPHMRERGSGSIVFIGSISGSFSAPNHGPYGVAKAGLLSLMRTLALENAPHGVRVNAVSPGAVRTPRIEQSAEPQALERTARSIPSRRLATPADIAGAVVFLLADAGEYVTGVDLPVDGGAHVAYPLKTVADD